MIQHLFNIILTSKNLETVLVPPASTTINFQEYILDLWINIYIKLNEIFSKYILFYVILDLLDLFFEKLFH